ncbi:hypothetical protein MAPG_02870 [Magnaporthiopsis poae ATCC 64411]|uniref:AB hydrolase-1 domain-containing protein n=1 Tax=Magnaporthiopsis poae (strain ATCC 64411 / 73-15) TaxID=644358 RepID=A0A0C4DSI8_MAGP6|nr:hypothetical protein MAPG_02870 [Magnaporthiopsis poae ATCC 64411]
MPSSLPPAPSITPATRYVAGHALTIYGLDELSPTASRVTILWLLHGRLCTTADMADVAARSVDAFRDHPRSAERGLLAIAFDQRNHSARQVSPLANEGWAQGNAAHAQDMFALVAGSVVDAGLLIDLVQGSLFPEKPDAFIDSHYVLGVSLGGHGAWQLLFADERVRTGVSIIGCPDYMFLMSDRAKKLKLPTASTADDGAGFLGSKDFPPDLVRACRKFDPKALVFGTQEPTWPLSPDGEGRVKQLLASRLRGKKILNCYGGADRLVPYRCSEPFLNFFKKACDQWAPELDVSFDSREYPEAGHEFADDMVLDAVKFIVDAAAAETGSSSGRAGGVNVSRI